MRRSATRTVMLLGAFALVSTAGCRSGGIPVLNLLGLDKPLVIALASENRPLAQENMLELLNPFGPYEPLRRTLSQELGQPVALELCLPLLVEPHLRSGFYHLAVVSPAQYARFGQREQIAILAVPVDEKGQAMRSALLVVGARSEIRSVENLRGKTVAFGPVDDARTHLAALKLLEEQGLAKTDLSLELLPIPGSLKHMPDMRSIAQTVINGSSDAGFIDEAAWEEFPEHEPTEGEPARDKLRVIGKTLAVPDRLIVCSGKLDDATAGKVRAFLVAAGKDHPEILKPLRCCGYQAPTEDLRAACERLVKPKDSPET